MGNRVHFGAVHHDLGERTTLISGIVDLGHPIGHDACTVPFSVFRFCDPLRMISDIVGIQCLQALSVCFAMNVS